MSMYFLAPNQTPPLAGGQAERQVGGARNGRGTGRNEVRGTRSEERLYEA